MNSVKCPACSLTNWSANELCLRCKSPLSRSQSPYSRELPADEKNPSNTVFAFQIAISGAAIVLILFGAYKFTRSVPPSGLQKPTTAQTAVPLDARKFNVVGEHVRDVAFWQVREPNLAKLADESAKLMAAGRGTQITIEEAQTRLVRKGTAYPGNPNGTQDEYANEAAMLGICAGKAENIVALDYWIEKPGENILLHIMYEADVYWGSASGPKSCGPLIPKGRGVANADYVWQETLPGFKDWVRLEAARADPKFKDSVLEPDTLAIGIEENKKFEEKLRQEREEQAKRLERYRAKRASQKPPY